MLFIDTHAHLYDEQYTNDIATVMQESIQAGVQRMYLPNLTLESIPAMLSMTEQYPNMCRAMLGLHPCEVKKDYQQQLSALEPWFKEHSFIAIGEVGIDLYWDKTCYPEQLACLHVFIDWALAYNLPLALHVRNSFPEVLDVLKDRKNKNLRGVFHCFSGSLEEAQQVIKLGFSLGIGGIVTFKKSHLPPIIEAIDIEHIVLETDAPYLAPSPYRGKRNHPAYLPVIGAKIAEIKGSTLEKVASATTRNACMLFGDSFV